MTEIAALLAALCWAGSSVLSIGPARAMGSMAYVRWRITIVVGIMLGYLIVTGQIQTALLSIPMQSVLILLFSGVLGIWFGDSMLFRALPRLGPRRTSILFATNAPMQVVLGIVFLHESFSFNSAIGCFLVVCGTYLAIVFGKRASQQHEWEDVKGLLIVGITLGLLAALGQALGAFIAKPVMSTGISPVGATIIRITGAMLIFWVSVTLPLPSQRIKCEMTPKIWAMTAISGTVGMALGMSFLLYALRHGELGITAVLSSTSPVLLLPIIWYRTKERPAAGAWVGAILAVTGVALIK